MSKARSARITERAIEKGKLFIYGKGRYRCVRCRKLYYPLPEMAHDAMVRAMKSGNMDPGAHVYQCPRGAGYHIGHPGGWKSLQRLLELAGVPA